MPITDKEMTRFFITLAQGVSLVIDTICDMYGGEIVVPKLPSVKILDLLTAFGHNIDYKVIGTRAGEKMHEVMIPEDEMKNAIDMGSYYIIQPDHHWWNISEFKKTIKKKGKKIKNLKEYSSNLNNHWLKGKDLKKLINEI